MDLHPLRLDSRHSKPYWNHTQSSAGPDSEPDIRVRLPPLTRSSKEEPERLFELTGLPLRNRSLDTPTLPALRDVVPEIQNQTRIATRSEKQSLLKQGGYAPAVERSMSVTDEPYHSKQFDSRILLNESSEALLSRKRSRSTFTDIHFGEMEHHPKNEGRNPWDGQHRADFFDAPKYRRTSQQSINYSDNSSPYQSLRELPRMEVSEGSPPGRNDLNHPPATLLHHRSSSGSDLRSRDWSDYALDSSRPVHRPHYPPYPQYSHSTYGYDQAEQVPWRPRVPMHHNQPMLNHSQPMNGFQGQIDRSPFSIQQFQGHRESPFHSGGMHEAGKTKKRRGNLPKESTDFLMAWFIDHWERAYPDEPTKLRFCERTGMVMNQVANWFINTRRRKLPNIAKKKLAEQNERDARVARGEELTPEEKLIPRITQERINEILGQVQKEQVELKVHGAQADVDAEIESGPNVPQKSSNGTYRFESLGEEEGSDVSDGTASPLGDEMAVPRSMIITQRTGNSPTPAQVPTSTLKMENGTA